MTAIASLPPNQEGVAAARPTTRRRRDRRLRVAFVVSIAPAVILTVALLWVPMASVVGFSFTDFDGFLGVGKFVGLDNYVRVFTDDGIAVVLGHTIIYTVFYLVVQLVLAFGLAIALTARIRFSSFYRSIFFIPVVVSPVAVVFVWSFLYDPNTGSINVFLRSVGLGAFAQNWLGNFDLALYSVILVDLWKSFGYFVVIFVAGLSTVPQDTLESARVDGAGWWSTLVWVTVPQLKLTFGLAIVLAMNGALRAFDTVYLLTHGGPGNATQLYMTQTFKEAFTNQKFGFGSAMAVLVLIVLLVVSAAQRRLTRLEGD